MNFIADIIKVFLLISNNNYIKILKSQKINLIILF